MLPSNNVATTTTIDDDTSTDITNTDITSNPQSILTQQEQEHQNSPHPGTTFILNKSPNSASLFTALIARHGGGFALYRFYLTVYALLLHVLLGGDLA